MSDYCSTKNGAASRIESFNRNDVACQMKKFKLINIAQNVPNERKTLKLLILLFPETFKIVRVTGFNMTSLYLLVEEYMFQKFKK